MSRQKGEGKTGSKLQASPEPARTQREGNYWLFQSASNSFTFRRNRTFQRPKVSLNSTFELFSPLANETHLLSTSRRLTLCQTETSGPHHKMINFLMLIKSFAESEEEFTHVRIHYHKLMPYNLKLREADLVIKSPMTHLPLTLHTGLISADISRSVLCSPFFKLFTESNLRWNLNLFDRLTFYLHLCAKLFSL